MAIDAVGMLLIRAWTEDGSERPLRVDVKFTCDTRVGFEHELTLTEPEGVQETVRAWLKEVVDSHRAD